MPKSSRTQTLGRASFREHIYYRSMSVEADWFLRPPPNGCAVLLMLVPISSRQLTRALVQFGRRDQSLVFQCAL